MPRSPNAQTAVDLCASLLQPHCWTPKTLGTASPNCCSVRKCIGRVRDGNVFTTNNKYACPANMRARYACKANMRARHRVEERADGCVEKYYTNSSCANEGIATLRAVWTDAKLTGPRTQGTLHGYGATHDRKRHLNRPPSPPVRHHSPPSNPPAGYTSAAAPRSWDAFRDSLPCSGWPGAGHGMV